MTFYKLKINNIDTLYKFPTKRAGDYPYCDPQGNSLERLNETKQQKIAMNKLNNEIIVLQMTENSGIITEEEKQKLITLQKEYATRKEIYDMKAYYLSGTGIRHDRALKLVDGVPMDSFRGRTSVITENEFRYCEINEPYIKEYEGIEKGFMISKEWFKILKDKNQGIKMACHYGNGWNEVRTYIYPSKIDDILIMIKVTNKEELYERLNEELAELRQLEEMRALLEQANNQTRQINSGRIAGNIDTW